MDTDKLTEMRLGDQAIRYDRKRTQHVYSGLDKGGADECGCIYCQNVAAQRDSASPDSFNIEGGKFTYGGWFYFIGEMIEAGENPT